MREEIVKKARELLENEGLENRSATLVRLGVGVLKLLKKLIEEEEIVTETGKKYPIAWLIEDIILWVLSDEERLEQFLNDIYEEEEIPEPTMAW